MLGLKAREGKGEVIIYDNSNVLGRQRGFYQYLDFKAIIMNKFFFQVEFAKGISDADILSFCDCLETVESDSKWKNMLEQPKLGKLPTILCPCKNCVTVFLQWLVGIPR